MRYADCYDWVLLFISFILNVVFGIVVPLNTVIFRGIVDVLTKGQSDYDEGKFDVDHFTGEILPYIFGYAGLGLGSFILNMLAVS